MWSTNSTIGAVLQDRYRLDSLLGTGASARVYLAYDLMLRREVAIKRLHPGLSSDEAFLARFRSEARAAAALNHPNVVQIYDWGQDDEGGFLVLEYLAGGSLRDLLDHDVVLGPAEVAQIGMQAASALSFAHTKGIVHRDVKPANLLFDEAGNVHVADFGLARAMVDASWTEPLGMVFGTARYASPEQAKGANIDERSDVYSLALVCYEALVGTSPFLADTPLATLMARIDALLPDPSSLGALEPALVGATTEDPHLRLDANEFAAALARISASLPRADIRTGTMTRLSAVDIKSTDETAVIGIAPTEEISLPRDDSDDPVVRSRVRRRRRLSRRWMVGVVATSLALVLAALLFVRFGIYGNTVPSVANLARTMATSRLQHAGLRIGKVTERYSTIVGSGEVISQSVHPGSNVSEGTVVNLVVSRGHAPESIPKLIGLTSNAATRALRKDGFSIARSHVFSETAALNVVVAATPSVGDAPYGSTVTVAVSMGPHPRTIPDLSGMSIAQARTTLQDLRLLPKNARAYSNDVPSGEVISSNPAAGSTGIAVGSKVKITISRGPQLVAVPNVAGMSVADAIAALQAAGLSVTEEIGPPFATVATTTSPGPGAMVLPNSSVTLYSA